jgi:hypothetical protein
MPEIAALVVYHLEFWWWQATYRLRWWSPEARADRARDRYRDEVDAHLMALGCHEDIAAQLTDRAFLALHRAYQAGRSIDDPRKFAINFACRNCGRV